MDSAGYVEAEKELQELIQKKKDLDRQISGIEVSIYALETAYLEETPYGNVVKVINHFSIIQIFYYWIININFGSGIRRIKRRDTKKHRSGEESECMWQDIQSE